MHARPALDAGKRAVATLGAFGDGPWILRVDREWDGASGNIQQSTDAFSEDDYKPVDPVRMYTLVVSDSSSSVTIDATATLKGTRVPAAAERAAFTLSDGTFAGGRFEVWQGAATLEAELTLYGSGRPIVKSERGSLTRQ